MANSQKDRSTKFNELRIERLRQYEEEELEFYEDDKHILTVGLGYTPVVKGSAGWVLRPGVGQHFREIGVPLSKSQISALSDFAGEYQAGRFSSAKTRAAFEKLRTIKLSKGQAAALTLKITPEYTGVVERTLGQRKWDFLQRNMPLAAAEMATMAYQSPRNFASHGEEIADLALLSRPNPFNMPGVDGEDGSEEPEPMGREIRFRRRKQLAAKLAEAGRIDPPRYAGSIAALFEPDEHDVVQVGRDDSLNRIARNNNVDPADLAAANPEVLGEPGKLRAGATLSLFGLRRLRKLSEQNGNKQVPLPRPRPQAHAAPIPRPRPFLR